MNHFFKTPGLFHFFTFVVSTIAAVYFLVVEKSAFLPLIFAGSAVSNLFAGLSKRKKHFEDLKAAEEAQIKATTAKQPKQKNERRSK